MITNESKKQISENETEKILLKVETAIKKVFGDAVEDFVLKEFTHCELKHRGNECNFEILFKVYDYYWIYSSYLNEYHWDDGISFGIRIGKKSRIDFENCSFGYSKIKNNLVENFKKVKKEVELRIPDKYLIDKGWLPKGKN